MTINFYLDSKLSNQNEKTINCFIRGLAKQKTIYINTRMKVNPTHWNNDKQCFRKSLSNYSQFNSYLDKLKNEINSAFVEYSNSGSAFSTVKFKNFIENFVFKQEKDTLSFYQVLDLYIETKKNELSFGSLQKYKTLKQHLMKFETYAKVNLEFNSFNSSLFDNLNDYFINVANLTNNTISKEIQFIKTFMNWALEREYHKNLDFKKYKTKETDVDVIYLTEEELFKLYNMNLEDNPRLSKVRDCFCLACFTGARYSDISNLHFEDIRDDVWHLRTKKTKDILEIPLNDFAKEIIQKYSDYFSKMPTISNQKSNEYLKELCRLAKLDEPVKIIRYRGPERIETQKMKWEVIGTHTARRTFVTLSLEKGMRPETVMEITGHHDYKTMKKYIKITLKVKKNEMISVWNKQSK